MGKIHGESTRLGAGRIEPTFSEDFFVMIEYWSLSVSFHTILVSDNTDLAVVQLSGGYESSTTNNTVHGVMTSQKPAFFKSHSGVKLNLISALLDVTTKTWKDDANARYKRVALPQLMCADHEDADPLSSQLIESQSRSNENRHRLVQEEGTHLWYSSILYRRLPTYRTGACLFDDR